MSAVREVDAITYDRDEALGNFLLTLRARGQRDVAILNAIERAPRAAFVPLRYVGFAYQNMSIPLDCGQETGSPFEIVERINYLQIEPHHHVLEIGAGTGWQTAVIAGLARAVLSIERWHTLAESADARVQALGLANTVITHGDGEGGMPAAGPFDRIIFNAAIEELSPLILAQLADGGQVLAPVISEGQQFLMRYEMEGDRLMQTALGATDFAPVVPGMSVFL
ncbi:MAG: protein-L-isoaspartate(D-aspartate) O-methyltransferase [Beijerinckiaceae bacterium]